MIKALLCIAGVTVAGGWDRVTNEDHISPGHDETTLSSGGIFPSGGSTGGTPGAGGTPGTGGVVTSNPSP